MPTYPTQTAYQDAVAHPEVCFADPVLRTLAPCDLTAWGAPLPITGQFANVYRMRDANGSDWAIKLFLRPVQDRAETYRAVQEHFASDSPPWLTPFTFLEAGVRVGEAWYPVVQMPWLTDAAPLNAYVGTIANDPTAVEALADTWRTFIADAETRRFAHGDLQHGNILVQRNASGNPLLHLLDYDGVWVPALSGNTGTETGHPAYNHPNRTPGDYGFAMDRFAAIAVYAALLILVQAPELWYRFDNGDNLLWRREDFAETRASGRALSLLAMHQNAVVRRVAGAFRAVCEAPMALVPDLTRFIGDATR